MKHLLAVSASAVIFAAGLIGCANSSERSTTTTSNATPGQRSYSSEDLNRTGKRTSGEQLQAADPSVSTTH